jgi:hypothetical protein
MMPLTFLNPHKHPFVFFIHATAKQSLRRQDCSSKQFHDDNNNKFTLLAVKLCEILLACMLHFTHYKVRFMPSVAKRKQKNTDIAHRKKEEREKEAKKKAMRNQLPPKGKK